MGEVGVNPDRVAQAATALEQLRDALAANVPVIVNTLNQYWSMGTGSPVNLGALSQAVGRSPGDAADMRTRARLAALWQQQQVSLAGNGMVNIPFSGSALENADAQAEAQALAAAENNKDPKAALAAIQAIQQDLQDHLKANDTAWLSAFYSQAAPQVAALAATLHKLDAGSNPAQQYANRFTVLTQAGQQIMATFGQGLAAADKPKAGLTPQAVQAIANAPDAWSAAMLVKYGPPGSSWATNETPNPQNADGVSLLALLTSQVYRAQQNGTLRIPLGGGYYRYGPQDQQQLAQTLASNDPIQVMLQADAQNKNASWQVMGGPNGGALAGILLNRVNGDLPGLDGRFVQSAPSDRGQYPGFFTMVPPGKSITTDYGQIILSWPSQQTVGAFLDAATSAPRAGNQADAKYAAYAAYNIILNTPSPNGDNGIKLDPAVQRALLDTAQRYLLDLANSTTSGASAIIDPSPTNGPLYTFLIKGTGGDSPLSSFLDQVCSDGNNAGTLNGAAKTQFGIMYALQSEGKLPPPLEGTPDHAMAALLGRIQVSMSADNISGQQLVDAQHAEYNSMIEFGQSAASWIPVVGDYTDKAVAAAKLVGIPLTLSTDNAAIAQQQGMYDLTITETQLHVPMVQGLINAGKIPQYLLKGQSFYQAGADGQPGYLVLHTDKQVGEFQAWYDRFNGSYYNWPTESSNKYPAWNIKDAENGYYADLNVQRELGGLSAINPGTGAGG